MLIYDNDRDDDVEGGDGVTVSMMIRTCMRSLYYRCGVEIIMIESTVFLHSDDGGTDHEEVPVYLPL